MSSRELPVPFFDWQALYAERADDYRRIIDQTAAAGGFILQAAVDAFEAALADYLGVRHAIGLSDCTNAMLLGLRASGLRAGEEVIMPGHGFIAAAQSIHFAGGTVVPVELGNDRLIDPDAIRAAITPHTRAIMAVHVNGRVCDMAAIHAIADGHGLLVVEDAAQALGATFHGTPAGRFGQWGAFSFYPSKTLGCFGDAGALVTDDDDLAATVRAMRNHGAGPDKVIPADCAIWGTNARIDNLHAAMLAYKLGWYDETIARRRSIAARYHSAFSEIAALDLPPAPDADPDRVDIFQNYELCCDRRDDLRAHLAAIGIGTIVQWGGTGIHQFRNLGLERLLPRTDRFFARSLLLPMNHLLSDDQVDRVIHGVRGFFA
ncbi:MAG: DegT/DnrJ/EryC1/StrS family aminotransferase [Sphingomonas sp.]|uniref:DegT/DnrJ/EryC1/StrS family aminotransferase n=1 Tax=Sphingomonas sp. TaxID=28214 RepID=UPI003F8172CE